MAVNIQSMDDIQELFKKALAGFIEGSFESELDTELGNVPNNVRNKETDNSRNGHSKNTPCTKMFEVFHQYYASEFASLPYSTVVIIGVSPSRSCSRIWCSSMSSGTSSSLPFSA